MDRKPKSPLQQVSDNIDKNSPKEAVFQNLQKVNEQSLFDLLTWNPREGRVELTKQQINKVREKFEKRFKNNMASLEKGDKQIYSQFLLQSKTRLKLLDGEVIYRDMIDTQLEKFIKDNPQSIRIEKDTISDFSSSLAKEVSTKKEFDQYQLPSMDELQAKIQDYLYKRVSGGKRDGMTRVKAIMADNICRRVKSSKNMNYITALSISQTLLSDSLDATMLKGSLRSQYNKDLSSGLIFPLITKGKSKGAADPIKPQSDPTSTSPDGDKDKVNLKNKSNFKDLKYSISKNPTGGFDINITWSALEGAEIVKIEAKYSGEDNVYSELGTTDESVKGVLLQDYEAGKYKIKLTPLNKEGIVVGKNVTRTVVVNETTVDDSLGKDEDVIEEPAEELEELELPPTPNSSSEESFLSKIGSIIK